MRQKYVIGLSLQRSQRRLSQELELGAVQKRNVLRNGYSGHTVSADKLTNFSHRLAKILK